MRVRLGGVLLDSRIIVSGGVGLLFLIRRLIAWNRLVRLLLISILIAQTGEILRVCVSTTYQT